MKKTNKMKSKTRIFQIKQLMRPRSLVALVAFVALMATGQTIQSKESGQYDEGDQTQNSDLLNSEEYVEISPAELVSLRGRRMIRDFLGTKVLSQKDMNALVSKCMLPISEKEFLLKRNKTTSEKKRYHDLIKKYNLDGSSPAMVIKTVNHLLCKQINDIIKDSKDQDILRSEIEQMQYVLPICFINEKELKNLYKLKKLNIQRMKWFENNRLGEEYSSKTSDYIVKSWNSKLCDDVREDIANKELSIIVSEAYTKVKNNIPLLPRHLNPTATNIEPTDSSNEKKLSETKMNDNSTAPATQPTGLPIEASGTKHPNTPAQNKNGQAIK